MPSVSKLIATKKRTTITRLKKLINCFTLTIVFFSSIAFRRKPCRGVEPAVTTVPSDKTRGKKFVKRIEQLAEEKELPFLL